jgi:tetraacyldisaccharide 4'-kinase
MIYGAAAQIRNHLYDRGILRARRLSQPVISVGNLSVGGSGKTPFVMLLGELLKSSNLQFDVLSRGYGRRTRRVLAVDCDGSPDDFGDETADRAPGCPVIVGKDRYHAGIFAEHKFGYSCTFDDGFASFAGPRFDIVMLIAGSGRPPAPGRICVSQFDRLIVQTL